MLGAGSEGLAEDGTTTKEDDPICIRYEMRWWHRCWREERKEPAPSRTLAEAVRYLKSRSRWAATSHPGFPRFVADVGAMRAQLEAATGRHRAAVRAGADCFSCGGSLVRPVGHDGLEETQVTCQQCGERYDPSRYNLALKAAAEDASHVKIDGEQWATLAALASLIGRSQHSLAAWRRDGLLRVVRRGGVVFLSVEDAEREHASRARRVVA